MKYLLICTALLFSSLAFSEVSIIVHPSNNSTFSKEDIKSIFLGKIGRFPNGKEAVPVTISDKDNEFDTFTKGVLSKSKKQYKAYWSKMMFTGKGTPPKQISNTKEMLDLVANNPNLIGVLVSGSATNVKVVGTY